MRVNPHPFVCSQPLGILFVKDKGQHILKNPLVINSMIEKVCT